MEQGSYTMKLYSSLMSSCSCRVRLALHMKGFNLSMTIYASAPHLNFKYLDLSSSMCLFVVIISGLKYECINVAPLGDPGENTKYSMHFYFEF